MNRYEFPLPNYYILPQMLDIEKYIQSIPNPINLMSFVGPNFTKKVIDAITTQRTDRSIIYSCECGNLQGNYYKDSTCPLCNTKVTKSDQIKVNVIFPIPFSLQVLHPSIYIVLMNTKLKKYIDIMFDPKKEIPEDLKDIIKQQGFVYNSSSFISTISNIIQHITKGRINSKYQKILKLLYHYSDILFTNQLFISSTIHTIESRQKNLRIVDDTITDLLRSIFDMLSLQFKTRINFNKIHSVIYNSYKNYIQYLKIMFRKKEQVKKAIARGSIFGTSMFFTLRAVINPITEPHEGDEIHIPWSGAIELFKLHIINKLNQKYNFKIKDAIRHINKHFIKYCPIIDSIFKELIEESPCKGIPVLINRNPSIMIHSLTLVYITKVLPNTQILKVSDMIIEPMGSDFD